jgi:hypothetical protein
MKYTGKILINTRNVIPIHQILTSPDPPKGRDLNTLLSFLSVYALSDGLLYDNTVPPEFIESAKSTFKLWGIEKDTKPLKTLIDKEFHNLVTESLNQCTDEIILAMANFRKWKGLSEDKAVKFYEVLLEVRKAKNYSDKRDLAYKAYNSNVMGGKLLIALADPLNETIFRKLLSKGITTGASKSKMVDALIGTYRTFLLSTYSEKNGALYNTDPDFVSLLENKNLKSWATLMKQVQYPTRLSYEATSDDMSMQLPIIGAAILLNANDRKMRPLDLIIYARKSASSQRLTEIQKELIARYTRAQHYTELIEEMDELCYRLKGYTERPQKLPRFSREGLKFAVAPTSLSIAATYAATQLISNGSKLEDAAVSLVGGTAIGMVFSYYQMKQPQEVRYLNAVSTLSSYNSSVEAKLTKCAEDIWKRKLV